MSSSGAPRGLGEKRCLAYGHAAIICSEGQVELHAVAHKRLRSCCRDLSDNQAFNSCLNGRQKTVRSLNAAACCEP